MPDTSSTPKNLTKAWNDYDGPHLDLRELLARAEKADEVLHISGADWNLEVGTLAEIVNSSRKGEPKAILFDNIPGYPPGYRLLSGATNSSARLALTLGFPVPNGPMDVVQAYRNRMRQHEPIPPRIVETGPILENVDRDEDVDIFKFPIPLLHELDGGRYIGTDDLVIMRDPELDWINLSLIHISEPTRRRD
jgi:UbiD family decarboxylase